MWTVQASTVSGLFHPPLVSVDSPGLHCIWTVSPTPGRCGQSRPPLYLDCFTHPWSVWTVQASTVSGLFHPPLVGVDSPGLHCIWTVSPTPGRRGQSRPPHHGLVNSPTCSVDHRWYPLGYNVYVHRCVCAPLCTMLRLCVQVYDVCDCAYICGFIESTILLVTKLS